MSDAVKSLPQLAPVQTCSGCTACFAACPVQAITLVPNDEGFRYPQIDAARCVGCKACERVCPVLHPAEVAPNPLCYAARTQDESVRMASSSGGLFTEFAKVILAAGGVVFGCRLNEDLVAEHVQVDSLEGLAALRGSKYVQSDLKETFREAKALLQSGREVLFSGTPCQIAGLNGFLKKAYPNLLTVSVICFGAPSPAVFEKIKAEVEARSGKKVSQIFFRRKKDSWRRSLLEWRFADAEIKQEDLYQNPYINVFLDRLALRPSCYQCCAKAGRSRADVTLGDFWGIETVCPELDDDKGISAVILHTPRAKEIWSCISSALLMQEVTFEELTRGNPFFLRSVDRPSARERFMASFRSSPLKMLHRRCAFGPWYLRAVRFLIALPIRVLRKVCRLLKGFL